MRAANVEAAIELAADLKSRGEYNWFRGQVQDWDPASSLERKLRSAAITQTEYIAQVEEFAEWAAAIPELAYLTRDEGADAACAILQHHGVPTQYIDFTTEPSIAGFFSADAPETPAPGTESVIFCLNTQDLLRFYDDWKRVKPELQLEAVSVDVSNLWRLQAQHGCFIYANHPWYQIYDLDRIVFPWTGYPAYPQREQVYPLHKSPLERRLDEYLSIRRRREGMALAREKLRNGPMVWIDVTEDPPDVDRVTPQSAQWPEDLLERWTYNTVERYDSAIKTKSLRLRSGPNAPQIGKQVAVAIASMLRAETGLRTSAVDWQFLGINDDVLAKKLSDSSRALWNGLRRLPVNDEDLAHAFSTLAELCLARGLGRVFEDAKAANSVFKAPIYAEFVTHASVVSRGYCASADLRAAMRQHDLTGDPGSGDAAVSRLLLNNKPNQVFDFEPFARLFVRQIVPSQVAFDREPIIFNPAELSVFGLP